MANTWDGQAGLGAREALGEAAVLGRELMWIRALTIAALVLVVDDEPAFRDASQRLERRAHAVVAEAVDNGRAAMDLLTPVDAHGYPALRPCLRA